MLSLVLALAVTDPAASHAEAMAAFAAFARSAEGACPSRRLQAITAGDLSWVQEMFDARLPPAARERLARADRGDRLCAGLNGLSCPTNQTLAALRRTGMLTRFVHYACAHPAPAGVARTPVAPPRRGG